ncbi:hypothetical protein ACFL3Q_14600, partial [Planctomycetota bacterium]
LTFCGAYRYDVRKLPGDVVGGRGSSWSGLAEFNGLVSVSARMVRMLPYISLRPAFRAIPADSAMDCMY